MVFGNVCKKDIQIGKRHEIITRQASENQKQLDRAGKGKEVSIFMLCKGASIFLGPQIVMSESSFTPRILDHVVLNLGYKAESSRVFKMTNC